ncbi:MAG: ribosome small subunit-dependent GTPase A [Planctomycetota bacterium]
MANFARAVPLEERKARKQRAKQRKATRSDGGRSRTRYEEESDWDELEEFEAMGPRSSRAPIAAARADAAGQGEGSEGLVVGIERNGARVACGDEVRPMALGPEDDLAVGDGVEVREAAPGQLRLVRRLERHSVLARADPSRPGQGRVLAANVDLALVVLSVVGPPFKPGLFDRFQVALTAGGIEPLLVVNKLDLLTERTGREDLERQLAPYAAAGAAIHRVSTASGLGIDGLRAAVAGRTLVAVGHSGVGKSSLLNALDGSGVARAVGPVRASDGKGRHTTTSSELRQLPGDTRLIDTPGIRSLGLLAEQLASLDEAYPEVAAFALSCRFADCRHALEPDCAVRAALERGELPLERWQAYARLRGG